MKHYVHRLCRALTGTLAFALCLPLALMTVGAAGTALAAEDGESAYIAPAYVVDFTDSVKVEACSGLYQVATEATDEGMKLIFQDSGNGTCEDPYMNLALPKNVDLGKHHFFAMIVRTNKQDVRGELRFRSATTGNNYPCQLFNYQKTDDWQLIVVDITDAATVQFVPAGTALSGTLSNLRLDMFHNSCATDVSYEIKAYGLYETREAAETFIHFTPSGNTSSGAAEGAEGPNPAVKYADFWRGEAFASPAMSTRMRWVTYGFNSTATGPIDGFIKQGFGGVVSNVLFEKNYLKNDKQFEIVSNVYSYAKEQGMTTWIYDEYQWPSGKAFGLVLEGHDEYEATGIEHRIFKGEVGEEATFVCSGRDIRIVRADIVDQNGRRTLTAADGLDEREVTFTPREGCELHVYVLRYTHNGNENRDDYTTLRHVDLLNKDAVARFIEVTHAQYKDKMGAGFANVEAFFTDEPQFGNRAMTGYAVWTAGMEEKFKAAYGYDMDIAALFEGKEPEDMRCRMHYFMLVAKFFREAYTEQISAWCEQNGVASSGHLLFEECMTDQIETYGGDFMQIVGAMTIPGVDLLWVDPGHLLSKNHIGNAVGTRYVVSAAKNAGKDRVMVEFNPDAANALSDEIPLLECIAGASVTRLLGTTDYNVINPQYNLTGEEYRILNTYVGRLNTLLEGAVECGELAVFYPIATIQAMYDADSGHTTETNTRSKAFAADTKFQNLCLGLIKHQYLYTVLDDVALQNAIVSADGCLSVGNGAYTTVILPVTRYISATAMEKLVTFRQAGGTVIFVGDQPEYGMTAEEDARVAAAMATMADAPAYKTGDDGIYADLSQYVDRLMQVKTQAGKNEGFLMADFATDGREITYLVNTTLSEIRLQASYCDGYEGTVTLYYPANGMIESVKATKNMTVTLPAYEAVLVVRESTAYVEHLAAHTPYVEENTETQPDTDPVTESDTSSVTDGPTAADGTEPADKEEGCASLLAGSAALTAAVASAACLWRKRED